MASNPMQRKARNSFLLGMLFMLVLSGVVIAFLLMQLMNVNRKEKEKAQIMKTAYALKEDVKSGQVITTDMLSTVQVDSSIVPSNATADISVFENYALQDKEGNNITSKYESKDGATVVTKYITKSNKRYEVYEEDNTGELYIEKDGEKEYLQLTTVPIVAKVDMKANTILTTEMISKSDSKVQDDVRKQEYNVIELPTDISTGDYVDVRLALPNGQDYIVVSKKEVEIPVIDGVPSVDTVWMNLAEDDIIHLNCAIYDVYRSIGAKLYLNRYTEAGMQNAATVTYVVNGSTKQLLDADTNILEKAKLEIRQRYSGSAVSALRNNINDTYYEEVDEQESKIRENVDTSIQNSKTQRTNYLNGLAAEAAAASSATSTDTSTTTTTTTGN